MNTGIQDMINLGWKLALVARGQAPEALLDSYAGDRLPVMRGVLANTEALTTMIGAENPLARSLFNHLAPWIASTTLVQETGAARLAQIALGYRDSPLSDNHPHGGSIMAGDRVPDLAARVKTDFAWRESRLHAALDPTGFALLVSGAESSARLTDAVAGASVPVRVVEVAAPEGDAGLTFARDFGEHSVLLVRPDGYVAVAAGLASAPEAVARFVGRWLTAPAK